MQKKRLLRYMISAVMLMLYVSIVQAQNRTLRGKVKDEKGTALVGATVSAGKISVITGTDGSFSIEVKPATKVINFSFSGYEEQVVSIINLNEFEIVMKVADKSLEEVVVVGYNPNQRKATLTGAVSQIKGADIIKAPSVNISNNLVGRLPGLISTNVGGEPGQDGANLLIRGINTFSGGTKPLIVIDGVANRPGGFERLNASDIESVTILKDASAAIYGAQAANGVLLVTTKKGKSGKPQLSLSFNQGFNSWVKVPRLLTSEQYAILVNEQNKYSNQPVTFSDAQIQKFRDGSDPISYPNTDWIGAVAKASVPQSRVNLSFSGGNEKVKYYTSFGRLKQSSQFKNNSDIFSFTQYNVATNIEAEISNNFKISYDGQYRYQQRIGPASSAAASPSSTGGSNGAFQVFTGLIGSLPIYPARWPDGRLAATSISAQSFPNPLATTTDISGKADFNDIYLLNTIRYKLDLPSFVKGLFVDGFIATDFASVLNKDFRKSWSVYKYDASSQIYTEEKQTLSSAGLASLSQSNYFSRTITLNSKINFTRTFDDHLISSFVAFEQQKFVDEFSSVSKENFFTDNISQLDYGSSVNVRGSGNSTNTARRNFFGRINYAFRDKYFVEVQGRYDGSDKFPLNKRWGFFPSASAGWQVASEKWFQNIARSVKGLKLRASWGRLGNDQINPYQFLQFYGLNANGYVLDNQLVPTLSPGVLANPNFTWESAESYNVGLDIDINSSLFITADVFRQKRSNILSQRLATVPQYSGIVLPVENIGIMQNQGVDGSVTYRNNFGAFNFSISGNFTYARNKVLYVDEPGTLPEYQKRVGRPINSRLMYISEGLFQDQAEINSYATYATGKRPRPGDVKFVDMDKDGKITSLDLVRVDLGYTPEIIYGSNVSLSWKGFDISLLFAGQARAKIFFHPQSSNLINTYAFMFEGRSTPDKVTDKPSTAGAAFNRPQWDPNTHPFFFRNNAFLRLKNAELAYTIPTKWATSLKISGARFYVNGSNLLTFAKFNDIDPESLSRLDGKVFPVLRTINTGVIVNF